MTHGRGHFWLKGRDFNKLGRVPLDDASHQVSRLYIALVVSDTSFKVFIPKIYLSSFVLVMQQTGTILKLELFSTKKQMTPPYRNKKSQIAFSYVARGII